MPDEPNSLESRIRALENKFYLFAGAFAVVAVWLGVTSFYSIPKAIDDALKNTAAGQAAVEIETLAKKAKADSAIIAQIAADGTIKIGGSCFRPRSLVRCWGPGVTDHMTWIDNASECAGAKYANEGAVLVLAQC